MTRSRASAAAPARLGPERNDGDVFGEARTALDRHPDIPSAVHVHIAGGIATLTGVVQWPGEQALAVETVRAGQRRASRHQPDDAGAHDQSARIRTPR